ncbi:hypothetical protein [Sandaracinus amylolyticus]|uniref:hypothetical protein n=1 Tax=Sandaracinus amylolyticus TaxID=927083 RepID=UPI001F3B980B|nr:hypothetical protein [Sandaracinus amylolyticus]UJR81461.1 Hypothetical protein I5071_35200 [Sandaracinus amylolyticus]
MLAVLSSLVWPAPIGVEHALVDVAREMRCVLVAEAREEPATKPCEGCLRPIAVAMWRCTLCEIAVLAGPEVMP